MKKERDMNPENQLERKPATAEDREFMRQVHHRAYHDVVVKQFGDWNEEAQDKFFESDASNSPHEIILSNGEPCGYFSMEETEEAIELHELVILPEFQGKGIGSKILKEVLEKAKTKNIPARLQVLKENKAADLYLRLGFKETGETDTHILMELNPTESE